MSATNTGWRLMLLDAPQVNLSLETSPILMELVSPGPQGASGSASSVTSVNGETGAVTLDAADVGAAAAVHGHAISDVTGLQTALDGKAASSHTHPTTDISGLGALATLNSVGTSQIADGAVTNTKIGSKAVDTAKIENGAVQALQLDTNAVETAKINNKAVTLAKLQDIAGSSIIGRTAGTGTPEQIALSADFVLEDLIPGGATLSISTRTARSVLGRSAGTNGAPADIVASTDGHVLRRASGVLAFGTPPATGSSGQVMFNDSGVIAGDSGFTFDPLSDTVTVGSVAFTSNGELIRNTTNGQMDFMPAPVAANAFGVYMDFTSFTVGARMGVIRSDNGVKNPAGSYIQFETTLNLVNDRGFSLSSSDWYRFQTASQGNDTLQVGCQVISGNSASMALVSMSHLGNANRSPVTQHSDPHLYVYSSDATQANDFVRISHNQTDAVIESGAGNLNLVSAGDINNNGNRIPKVFSGTTAPGAFGDEGDLYFQY